MNKIILFGVLTLFAQVVFATDLEPTLERTVEIKQLVSSLSSEQALRDVVFQSKPDWKTPAGALPNKEGRKIIGYNVELLAQMPPEARNFILFHELGHIYLEHIKMSYPGLEGAKKYELEADTFACFFVLKQNGIIEDIPAFLEWINTGSSLPDERIQLIMHLLTNQ